MAAIGKLVDNGGEIPILNNVLEYILTQPVSMRSVRRIFDIDEKEIYDDNLRDTIQGKILGIEFHSSLLENLFGL